ncbi:MAG: GIY-YIG nuclease family protein [Verrucomicrobiae bacterium]|nr:GIY-YIG nuclease family protein [Verrucomicrobiae bacterium]
MSSTERPRPPRKKEVEGLPADVAAIRREITAFFDMPDAYGNRIGNSIFGVYAFYDYDGEPIYVGQTRESLRQRIGRHLTNQRTDAVAMNVLDPFEVAEIQVWPLDLESKSEEERKAALDAAEYSLFQKVITESKLGAVLNEKPPMPTRVVSLPKSYRHRIIPDTIYPHRKHPDIRIARRASTIASLARVISERDVAPGLRKTLLTQARRLERLAKERLAEIGNSAPEA